MDERDYASCPSFFTQCSFLLDQKLSYLHNFIINLSTHFSVVILEKQPIPSKIWFWVASRSINPTSWPQSGGPTGV